MVLALGACSLNIQAGGAYQQPEDFVREAFGGAPPEPSRLWLDAGLQAQIREVLGRDLGVLRVRYWVGITAPPGSWKRSARSNRSPRGSS